MDSADAWFYFRDDAVEKMNLNDVLMIAESVCNALGFKIGKSWEAYVNDLAKMAWTSLYLTSLELEGFGEVTETKRPEDQILHAVYDGPSGLKWKNFSERVNSDKNLNEVQCPETIVRKGEEPMDLDLVINEIQNKLFL